MEKEEIKLAEKLWEEIRNSLSMCGDVGDFNPEEFELSDIQRVIWNDRPVLPLSLLHRLGELKVEINEVFWNVYEALSILAAKRLGLEKRMAIAFADALTCVRTHMVGGHKTEAEQCIAQEIFLSKIPFEAVWDPDSPTVKTQLLVVYNKFNEWQVDPSLYKKEIEGFWKGRDT